MFSPPE